MSDEAVYRTAPATPGLLIMLKLFEAVFRKAHTTHGLVFIINLVSANV